MADTSYFAPDWDAPGWQSYVQARFMPRPVGLALHPARPGTSGSPEATVAAILANELRAAGVRLRGHGTGARPVHLRRLTRMWSPPLRHLAAKMNAQSDNYLAEMLGKRLGAGVFGRPGTIEKGARAISRWATGHGVRARSHDASGLSYTDRLAPAGMVRLLDASRREPWGPAFRRSLPRPGEGTLSGRLGALRVRAKTGTHFNGDSALSGWVRLDHGGRATFSILSNAMPKPVEDSIVAVIARSARVPRAPSRRAEVGGPALAV
jgi:PBP4 family serine-type D-alanyl-D-alanine carboxypeptidase